MVLHPIKSDGNELSREAWDAVRSRMRERQVSAAELSRRTGYPEISIHRGISGEDESIGVAFLRNCVIAFSLTSHRAGPEYTEETLTFEQCVDLIRPATRPQWPFSLLD